MVWLATLKAQIIIAAIIVVVSFGGGVKVTSWYYKAKLAEEIQAEIDAKAAWIKYGDEKSRALEKKLAELRRNFRDSNQRTQNEIKNNDIYSRLLPDSGVRLYNEAVQGGTSTSQPDPGMRPTSSPSITSNGWGFLHSRHPDGEHAQ